MSSPLRAVAAVLLGAALLAVTPSSEDPWAPGATVEPWPTVARLQAARPEAVMEWTAYVKDPHAVVRAAAASAIGRVRPLEARVLLQTLLADPALLVRRTAQWALLQLDGPDDTQLVAELADIARRPAPPYRRLDDFDPFSERGSSGRAELSPPVPGWVALTSASQARRALATARLSADIPYEAPVSRVAVAVPHSELDGDDILDFDVVVTTAAAQKPGRVRFKGELSPENPYEPLDAPRTPDESRAGMISVAVRVVGGAGSGEAAVPPSSTTAVTCSIALDGLAPDVYALRLHALANPVFLRVRRSREAEAEGRQAAQRLGDDMALATVERLRVRAAAAKLRQRFREGLAAYGFGYNAYRAGLALARVGDTTSAGEVLEAALAQPFEDPWTLEPLSLKGPLFRRFGSAAIPHLERVAEAWRARLAKDDVRLLSEVLAERSLGPPSNVDRVRLEILAEMGPEGATTNAVSSASPAASQRRRVAESALAGAAGHHPQEAGAYLARQAADVAALSGAQERAAAGLSPEEQQRLFDATWAALPGSSSGPDDARSALRLFAERRSLRVPEAARITIATEPEVLRQLEPVTTGASEPGREAMRRAREFLRRTGSPAVARLLAQFELSHANPHAAAAVAPDPDQFTGLQGERADALLVRGLIQAALGRLEEARVDLRDGLAHATPGRWRDIAAGLAERLERVPSVPGLRVRLFGAVGRGLSGVVRDNALWSLNADGRLRRWSAREELAETDVRVPFSPAVFVPLGRQGVVAGLGRTIQRFDAGREDAAWTVTLDQPLAIQPGPALLAGPQTTLALDKSAQLHAWSTTAPPSARWRTGSVERFALLDDPAAVLLVTRSAEWIPRRTFALERRDARSGALGWHAALPERPAAWAWARSLVVTTDEQGALTAHALQDGRRLWHADRRRAIPGGGWFRQNVVVAAGPDESVWAVVGSTLHRLSARDGSTLWSAPYQPPPEVAVRGDDRSPHVLFPTPDGSVWWAAKAKVFVTSAGDSADWSWDVSLVRADGTVSFRQWNPTHNAPVAFADGTLLRFLKYGGFDAYEPVSPSATSRPAAGSRRSGPPPHPAGG